MKTPMENAIETVNAYSMYVSGVVAGAATGTINEDNLGLMERGCKQLEAACEELTFMQIVGIGLEARQ